MSRKFAFLLILALSIITLILVSIASASNVSPLTVSFIDVGQGDSALIHGADDFDILIDGGWEKYGPNVEAYIRDQGIDDIDVMIASHADGDHVGGLTYILELDDITVEQVFYNGYPGNRSPWFKFATAVAEEGLTLNAAQFPMTFTWGAIEARVLNPDPGLVDPNTNDASVVLIIDFIDVEFLFTGDIPKKIESTVVERGTSVDAEVLKVPHHGSDTSTGDDLLNAVQPTDAVISVGKNSHGHPSDEVIARILNSGARLWRTDQHGTIIFSSDGYVYTIQTTKPNLYLPILLRLNTPTPTGTPGVSDTGDIDITTIFYDGAGSAEPDEYVEIYNNDVISIQLEDWTLRDESSHVYTFPNHIMQPGDTCRVYTNEDHPEYCGFNYGSGSAIWTNTGDCAYLRDSHHTPIDEYCYP